MSAEAAPNLGLRVLHPTDFSEASEVAFVHALKLTLAMQGRLHVLHVASRGGPVRWRSFPGVREALERWACFRPEAHPRRSAISGSRS
jgi:nucleotide-binding universal stress UspA family protein